MTTCKGPECSRDAKRKGMCDGHARQVYDGRPLTPLRKVSKKVPAMDRDDLGRKMCTTCRAYQPEDAFNADTARPDNLSPYCNNCKRATHLLRTYGITLDDYQARLDKQGGRCAGCGDEPAPGDVLHVDHDHGCCATARTCGQCIRGLLCKSCNTVLGLMRDDSLKLRTLADYADRHKA